MPRTYPFTKDWHAHMRHETKREVPPSKYPLGNESESRLAIGAWPESGKKPCAEHGRQDRCYRMKEREAR